MSGVDDLERWLSIEGYEGRYEVSDQGRVRSLRRRGRNQHSSYDVRRPEPRALSAYVGEDGYGRVQLGAGACRKVHTLVLRAFVGPRPVGREGAHLNGRRDDNRAENLRWVTHAENEAHKVQHRTQSRGERNGAHTRPERVLRGEQNGGSRLTAVQVVAMRAAAARGETQRALGTRFGVHRSTVGAIVRGDKWRHLIGTTG